MNNKKAVNPEELQSYMDKRLYNWYAAKTLAYAWNAGENVLFTGPGGYGKSDGATIFFNFLKEKGLVEDEHPFVLSFGQGMTEERLFSGIDIKRFQEEGELVYNLKKAFVSYEVVIFEELFDAFAGVLLILKDVLQSGEVRMGDTRYPLKTKIVVACTNRSYDEVVVDNSTAALMERFVFQEEVTWTSWEASDYTAALGKNYNGEFLPIVADICAKSSKREKKVSPRTAFKALKSVIKNNTIHCLKSMLGFDRKVVAEAATEYQTATNFAAWRSDVADYLEESPARNSARAWIENAAKGHELKTTGNAIALTDAQINQAKWLIEKLEDKFNSSYKAGKKLVDIKTTNPYFMGVAKCESLEEFLKWTAPSKPKQEVTNSNMVLLSCNTIDRAYVPCLSLQTDIDTVMDCEKLGWATRKITLKVQEHLIEIKNVREGKDPLFCACYERVANNNVKYVKSWFSLPFNLEGLSTTVTLTSGVEICDAGKLKTRYFFTDGFGSIWAATAPIMLQGFTPMPIPSQL